ncbi:phosphatase [Tenggerimyces flavus]|uniref:Phosphatase n=1 Tax=Tenggerimyces flavus TaxID=1708749 RepID=A0ABV7YBP3_9ACTN|nr:phosphatase [Tenggerimyces flavus]MBM7783584.1 hypothetical protein [Tenggerimyces flavus]
MRVAALPPAPTRAELREQLVASAIAGEVVTSREVNLDAYRGLARRERGRTLGLTFSGTWNGSDVLALMAEKVGVSPDESYLAGVETIDPDRCLDAIEAMVERLRGAIERGESVLLATSHVAALLPFYLELARTLELRGCRILTPAPSSPVVFDEPEPHIGTGPHYVRYMNGVAVLTTAESGLLDTHSPQPMEAVLNTLDESGEGQPDLVIGDHGWAGAAGEAGLDTVGFADCNDPALFVGEAEGKLRLVVPLDDDVDSVHYGPLVAYLLQPLG